MIKILPFTVALAVCSTSLFAQSNVITKNNSAIHAQKSTSSLHKTAIGGMITDARRHPIPGAEAFIYGADSSIMASGYTDSMGYYETNSVMPGKYNLKIVYPSANAVVVKAVVIKAGVTQVNLKIDPPAADTTMLYADLMPKPTKPQKGTAPKAK